MTAMLLLAQLRWEGGEYGERKAQKLQLKQLSTPPKVLGAYFNPFNIVFHLL